MSVTIQFYLCTIRLGSSALVDKCIVDLQQKLKNGNSFEVSRQRWPVPTKTYAVDGPLSDVCRLPDIGEPKTNHED
jgi:hypothetical protein